MAENAVEAGPLRPLLDHLAHERLREIDKDSKQADASFVKLLGSDNTSTAIQQASFDQVDLLFAHDGLSVELKPISTLILLLHKAAKVEQFKRKKQPNVETKSQYLRLLMVFLHQISQFFFQVPIFVASKEIKRLSGLCTQYVSISVELSQSIKAVYPLKSFLKRFHRHENYMLTPIHTDFFYICLHSKCYFAAKDILDHPIYEIHSAPNLVNSADFLQYAYYGGLLYLGQKRYVDATDFFLMALTAPATSISAIVIEAYKKLVLTSLIAYGKTVTLPKYTSLVVSRHVESHCVGYMEFSSAFHSNDVKKALKVLQMRLDEFKKAGNFGLAKQCLVALQHQKLIQLTRTYASISLEEIAMSIDLETELDVAEKKLLALISTGKIHATIDDVDKKKMVTFVEEEEQFDHDVILHQVHKELVKIMSISDQLRVVDANIVTSNKFVSEIKEKDHRLQHLQQQSGGNAVVPSGPSGLLSSIGSSGQQNGGESGWMED